jgi:N-acetylmuramoyl-L-alanine amidase|tara:strand:+ start:68 stop:1441 length:1374 start_codon:yes stop_codon:yes gene_type:complete
MILARQLLVVSKPLMSVLASLPPIFLLLVTLQVSAAATRIDSVRVRSSPERTRIVFDLSHPVEHKIFTLSSPERLVIDITDAKLLNSLLKVDLGGTLIRSMRSSSRNGSDVRVVLDLSASVKPRSFVLNPIMQYGDRLVIDLYTNDQQQAQVVQKADRITRQMRDVVIAIDAGHGGDDPGAIGHGRLMEKEVVLSIANKLHWMFKKETGFRSIMVRKGDYYLAHRKRTEIARQNQADIFISIHADAFKTAEASGASIYAISQKGATSEAARWLADKENRADLIGGVGGVSLNDKDDLLAGVILDLSMTASLSASLEMGESVLTAISRVNKLHKKHVEQAAFLVLKSPEIPSLLIETGFISNPKEARKLKSNSHQQKMAKAIFQGVMAYMQENPPGGSFLAWKKHGGIAKLATHIIVRGDTLSEIASRYRVSFKDLKQVNDLRGNKIRIGQILKIPAS